jgi:tetratricopeptide (TPR) repeat protein
VEENLLDILKDFQRLSHEDLYRFPIPKDVTGMNIMKATLIRLQDYEKKFPNRYSDVINFSKAMAYERLRDYNEAVRYYRNVAKSNGRLGSQAKKSIEALEAFQSILIMPLPTRDPFEYTEALDEKVEAWNEMVREYQGTAYEYLAKVEEERIDRAKVAFVDLNPASWSPSTVRAGTSIGTFWILVTSMSSLQRNTLPNITQRGCSSM